ncbi:hypothetical protein RDI58_014834 [Solanum bulbocastanum]|uniref:Protein kinase domain-containing protein n=1 Tax=Solanum bulbocastanum TaxID=147425 RepID=A0AAN8YAY1_SOLBU
MRLLEPLNLLSNAMMERAEFGWKERMKVATDYALLLKTLRREQFDLSCNGSEDIIIIDKEYNIKLVDFSLYAFPQTLGIHYSATISDNTFIEKIYAFGLGVLLLELITKKERAWKSESSKLLYFKHESKLHC